MTKIKSLLVGAGALSVLGISLLPISSFAATTSDVTVNVSVGSALSLACNGNYSHNYGAAANAADINDGANVTTNPTGSCAVTSNDVGGYTLTLADADTDTNLVNGSYNIPAQAGVPVAGTPGYAVTTNGGTNWLAIPASNGSALTVATTTTAGSGTHPYSFASSIASTTAAGTYENTVRFTVTAN